jgi:long-chain fatty acid transport protein
MVARFGGELGMPTTDDPTALYYNPAGIAFAHGTHIYVEGLFALRIRGYDRDPNGIDSPGTGTPDTKFNTGHGSLTNLLVSPFAGITSDLGVPNLGVGLSISVPFGGSQKWDKDTSRDSTTYPGAIDGSQRWSDIEGTIQAIYFTVGGAYRIAPTLSLGLAVNVVSTKTFDLRATTLGGTDDLVGNGVISEGRGLLDTTSITVGGGVVWAPTPDWKIGASYQSQPGFGTVTEDGTLLKKIGAGIPTNSNVEHKYSLPDVVRLGASFRATPSIDLRLWGSYERWSVFKQQCIIDKSVPTRSCDQFNDRGVAPVSAGVLNNIPRHWQDAVALRASGSYHVNPDIELQLGLGWDGNAIPDEALENSLPDENKINATAGAVFRNLITPGLELHASYSAFIGFDRTIAPRARNSDGTLSSPYDFPTRVPDSSGKYTTFISVLDIGVGYAF